MYVLCRFSLDAGHQIEDTDELETKKCARSHGHRYEVELAVDLEMLKVHYHRQFVDFALLDRDIVKGRLAKYDHYNITNEYGIHTVEELAEEIKINLLTYYRAKDSNIMVKVFETAKWGVMV